MREASMISHRLHIDGLQCANCAAKIEQRLQQEAELFDVHLDFVGQKLTLQSPKPLEQLLPQIQQISDRVEAGVRYTPQQERIKQVPERRMRYEDLLAVAAALFLGGMGFLFESFELWFFLAAYGVVATPILQSAWRDIRQGQWFDESMLMTIASLGALGIGAYTEGIAVMLFYRLGEWAQDLAVDRSRASIADLLHMQVTVARRRLPSGNWTMVDPAEILPGDLLQVRPGEKMPVDGTIVKGSGSVDVAALTGESVPLAVAPGSSVYAGSINLDAVLEMTATANAENSSVAKMLALIEDAAQHKAKSERFITRFARWYTPLVVVAAALLFVVPTVVFAQPASVWLYRALLFLVCGCPCALVLSVPLTFFAGVGGASKAGILVKGANHLESLAAVEGIVFDKTGTLTEGLFHVKQVVASDGNERALLALAAAVEQHSNHPVAQAVTKAAAELPLLSPSDLTEMPGRGLRAVLNGDTVWVGTAALLEDEGIVVASPAGDGAVVHIAKGDRYQGYIEVADRMKEETPAALATLRRLGIRDILLLSGDRQPVVAAMADRLGLDRFEAECLPADKVVALERFQSQHQGRVAFVGDGINDAPVLARADVGIAMGALGSDAAIEAADVVLMTDGVEKIPQAIAQARRTRRIVRQNVGFALLMKALIMLLGAVGLATMWAAVFADVGVALLAIGNAMRAMRSDIAVK